MQVVGEIFKAEAALPHFLNGKIKESSVVGLEKYCSVGL